MEANQVHDHLWLCNGDALECMKQLRPLIMDRIERATGGAKVEPASESSQSQ